ncbi:MAG: acyltransferase family protein [Coriobacteriales bacterium]|nr:acyltransferase family protein [Coriobacteriales bacterium]
MSQSRTRNVPQDQRPTQRRRAERASGRSRRRETPDTSSQRRAARKKEEELPGPEEWEKMKQRRQPRSRHVGALDGLKAIAIIAVVLYHLSFPWLPSGHMGVVVFLVLTGYLVTSSLMRSVRQNKFSLLRTWGHRIVRLWPPMAVMVVFTVALCAIFNHVLLTKLKPDLLPSLLLSNNLGAIFRGASYFDNLGGTSPLTHLWYLGVDLQFFLVWTPLCAFVLCSDGRPNRLARIVAFALAIISAILMLVLYNPNADPTRVYYGPDTRAFAPLLGAWLALLWPLGARPMRLDDARHTVRSLPLGIIGPVALLGILIIMVLTPDTSAFLYRGGMLLVALLCVFVIAGCLERKSSFSKLLSLPPLVWLGQRSFGIYLWHFPLFQLFKVTNNATSPLLIILAIALSVAAAELSYRLIEQPIAQHRIPLIVGELQDPRTKTFNAFAAAPALVVTLFFAIGLTGAMIVPDETAVPEGAIVSTGASAGEAMDLTGKSSSGKASASSSGKASSSSKSDDSSSSSSSKSGSSSSSKSGSSKTSSDKIPTGSITLVASDKSVSKGLYTPTIIADSVAGDAEWYFDEHMPNALLDSYVGRRPDQALSVLEGYLEQGVVGNIVVLASFSNVPATDDTMADLIESCGDRKVYLVNVRIPEVEQEQINDTIDRFVEKYDNVSLIDWYSYSEGQDSWIYADGEHLTPEGQPHYVDMISNAIAKDFAADGGTVLAEDES